MDFEPVIFVEHFHDGGARIYSRADSFELSEMDNKAIESLKAALTQAPTNAFFRGFGVMPKFPKTEQVLELVEKAANGDLRLYITGGGRSINQQEPPL